MPSSKAKDGRKSSRDAQRGIILAGGATAFSVAGGVVIDANGQPRRRFVKDLVRAGRWVNGNKTYEIPVERLDHWVETFDEMTEAGVKVPMPLGHTTDPDKNRGEVVEMYRDGETLWGVVELIGDDAMPLASRVEVSIYAEPEFVTGDGKRFKDAITHVALVTNPVINGQKNFEAIAASRVPVLRFAQENNMDWKELASMLGMNPEEYDDTTGPDAVKAKLKAMTEGMSKQAEEVKASKDALAKAEDRITALSKDKLPEADADGLDMAAEGVTAKLDSLAASGKITPAVKDKLGAVLCGKPGARPAVCLSRKVATAVGFDAPLAGGILAALADNDPVELKEQTKRQATAMSRAAPGASDEVDPQKAAAALMSTIGIK